MYFCEFPVDYTCDRALLEQYTEAAKEYGLMIAEVGAWCNPISPDDKVREAAFTRCVEQLKLADKIGARCCVTSPVPEESGGTVL